MANERIKCAVCTRRYYPNNMAYYYTGLTCGYCINARNAILKGLASAWPEETRR